jgi:Flp pilus assembly protein protease CpaA
VTGDLVAALHTVSASIIIFIVGFLLFWRRLIGGGDAKLMPAAALLVGYHDLVGFLLAMGVCGALVSICGTYYPLEIRPTKINTDRA